MCSLVQREESTKYQVEPHEITTFAGQNCCTSAISCTLIIWEFIVIAQDSQVITMLCECEYTFYFLLVIWFKEALHMYRVYKEYLLKFYVV